MKHKYTFGEWVFANGVLGQIIQYERRGRYTVDFGGIWQIIHKRDIVKAHRYTS